MTDNLSSGQFGQLPLFMSASEIMQRYQPLDHDRESVSRPETDDEVWDRKLEDTETWDYLSDMASSVRRNGVRMPVRLSTVVGSSGKPQVANGHHRIAVMHDTNPDALIPVLFEDTDDPKELGRDSYDDDAPYRYT